MTRTVPARRASHALIAFAWLLPCYAVLCHEAAATGERFSDSVRQPSQASRYVCSAASAQALLGQKLTDRTRRSAQEKSGASSVRVLRLDEVRDLSFVSMRLSIEVDRLEVITGLSCG